MELRIVAQLWLPCSSKATATTLVMSVTGDSRTLLQAVTHLEMVQAGPLCTQLVPTLQLVHSLRPALSGYLHTKLSACEMLLFTS